MHDQDQIEHVRQAIMRFRELLDIAADRLASGERSYAALFAPLTDAERALPEKQRQRAAALLALEDLEPLRRAIMQVRFDMHELDRDFEQLYDTAADDAG